MNARPLIERSGLGMPGHAKIDGSGTHWSIRNSRSRWVDALGASVSLELAQRAERDVLVVHAPGV